MKEYPIESSIGAGPIKLGADRKGVSSAVVEEAQLFSKAPGTDADLFKSAGVVVYYAPTGQCEAIEFYGPDQPIYDGKRLLGMESETAADWLVKHDDQAEIEEPDMTSKKLGIAFFARENKVATVLVFAKGYFDATPEGKSALKPTDVPEVTEDEQQEAIDLYVKLFGKKSNASKGA